MIDDAYNAFIDGLKLLAIAIIGIVIVLVITGCSEQNKGSYDRVHCENDKGGYVVFVGNNNFTDCTKPMPCMSSGCVFECGSTIVHTNEYYKVCP